MGRDASHTKPIVVSKADSVSGIDVGPSLDALQGPGGYRLLTSPRPNSPQFKDARGQYEGVQFGGSWGAGGRGVHTHQTVTAWPLRVVKIKICG